jgi:hypothetical protein
VDGSNKLDYVRNVLVLEKTKYFITIESLILGQAGVLRWKWGADSCYKRYAPTESSTGMHVYDMDLAPFSSNLLVSNSAA